MTPPIQNLKLNRLHQGAAKISIGALPVSYDQDDAPPEEAINASITSFAIPGFELDYATQAHYNGVVHIPTTEDNAYKGKVVVVNVIADDRQLNYWAFRRYMETIQSAQRGDGALIEDHHHRVYGNDKFYRNRLTYIPEITIAMADDSMQLHQKLIFHRCYPLVLSELNMNFNEPVPVTFNISFLFSNQTVKRYEEPKPDTKPTSILD